MFIAEPCQVEPREAAKVPGGRPGDWALGSEMCKLLQVHLPVLGLGDIKWPWTANGTFEGVFRCWSLCWSVCPPGIPIDQTRPAQPISTLSAPQIALKVAVWLSRCWTAAAPSEAPAHRHQSSSSPEPSSRPPSPGQGQRAVAGTISKDHVSRSLHAWAAPILTLLRPHPKKEDGGHGPNGDHDTRPDRFPTLTTCGDIRYVIGVV